MLSVVWRLWGWVGRVACVGSCLGVSSSQALPRALRRSLFGHTLSERRGTYRSTPGSLTARVLGDSGSAPPRVSTPSSSFVSRHLGPRVRSHTGSSQQSPAPWLRLGPRPLAGVSPSRRKACLFR